MGVSDWCKLQGRIILSAVLVHVYTHSVRYSRTGTSTAVDLLPVDRPSFFLCSGPFGDGGDGRPDLAKRKTYT